MMEPFYRFRNAFWSCWYSSLKTYFGVKKGHLYIPEKLIQAGEVKFGVRRIPMQSVLDES